MGINGVLYHYALTNNYTGINGDVWCALWSPCIRIEIQLLFK